MKAMVVFFVLLLSQLACQNVPVNIDPSNPSSDEPTSPGEISLSVDKLVYSADDTIHVRLQNRSDASLFLEGCSQLQIATKADTGWVKGPLWVCVWEGYAVEIVPDSSYVLDYPAEYLIGRNYFFAPVYFGCKDGEPISRAECERQEIISSGEFEVTE